MAPKASAAIQKSNGFVNLHWKASHEPEDLAAIDRSFLQRLQDSYPPGADGEEEECGAAVGLSDVRVPTRPATIFCPRGCAPDPPREFLEDFFGRRRSSWKPPGDGPEPPRGMRDRRRSMLDKKRLYMLGILVQKHLMENKGENNVEAVSSIKRAVLRCDFNVVRLEGLGVLRAVLQQHEKDGRPVSTFVRSYGDDALDGLDNPEHHRLVNELSKVPQIDERLECMLFHMAFRENFAACAANLGALTRALAMLDAKRDTIRCFFITAHRLGQSLNRESRAPQAPQGFQLSTLAKLSQTKSTKLPRLSILHFVLALMCRGDAEALFDEEDFALLQAVKALRTHKVFCDCVELVQGIYGVQQICDTGSYTCQSTGQAVKIEKRRKSVPPSSTEREPAIDTDDNFHEVMKEFVDANLEAAEDIAEDAMNAILKYKELALYFDDLRSVYPPPKNENDVKKDLCDIFYRFAEDIRHHREEVEAENLREILGASGATDEEEAVPTSSCVGANPSRPLSRWPAAEPCLYASGQQRGVLGMDGGRCTSAARGF